MLDFRKLIGSVYEHINRSVFYDIVNYLEAGALSVTIFKTPVSEGIISQKGNSDKDKQD